MTITKTSCYVILLLVLFCSDAFAAITVFMEDGSEIEAQSAWKDGERVYLQVNPDLRLDFPLSEVDVRKTNMPDAKQAPTPAVEKTSTVSTPAVSEKKPRVSAPVAPEKGKTASPAKSGDIMDELVEIAGIRRDFNDLFGNSGNGEIDRIFADTFSPELAEKSFKKHLEQKLSPRVMSEVLAWYKTPVGKKIVETESVMDFNKREKVLLYISMDSAPGFKERMDLVSQIEKTTGITEVEMRLAEIIFRSIISAIPPEFPEAKQIKQQIQKGVPSIGALRKQNVENWAYTYRELSTKELHDYLKFLRSADGKKYMAAVRESTEEIFKKVAVNIGKDLHNQLLAQMK